MVGDISSQILIVEQTLREADRRLGTSIDLITNECANKIKEAVALHEREVGLARVRLAALQSARSMIDGIEIGHAEDEPVMSPIPHRQGTVADFILDMLAEADHPISSRDIDERVMSTGRTKAASDKAKMLIKRNGWASVTKRLWIITDSGREANKT